MSQFDPYLKWLGIRETARPVNHYRLLGLELYESDKDVISMSADRQMAHIRTFQSGPNGKLSQQILNELARARRCLLVEEKKAIYDQQLKAKLGSVATGSLAGAPVIESPPIANAVPPSAVPVPIVEPAVVDSSIDGSDVSGSINAGVKLDVRTDPNARLKTKRREKKQLIWSLVSWVSGGLAAVGVGAFLLGSGILGGGTNGGGGGNGGGGTNGGGTVVVNNGGGGGTNGGRSNGGGSNGGGSNGGGSNGGGANGGGSNGGGANGGGSNGGGSNGGGGPVSPDPPSFELPVVWTLENVAKYPKPNNAERTLLHRVRADLSRDRVGKLESSAPSTAGTNGVTQKINGLEQPGFMIGVSYTVDSEHKIKNLTPVLRTATSFSRADGDFKSLLAKPGYAVGEVQVSVLNPIHCIRLRFMKVTQRGLDPDDSYFSSWIGREVGPVRTISNPLNAPIVGTYCDFESNNEIRTFGLIVAHKSMAPTKIVPENAAVAATEKKTFPKTVEKTVEKTVGKTTKETTANILGSSLPVISRSPVASNVFTSGLRSETIVFVNNLDGYVTVYKIDANLNQRAYLQIRPGDSRTITSELGMNWHVKKGDLSIATYRADLGKNTAIIDGRDPDIAGSSRLPEIAGLEKNSIPSSSDRNKAMKEVKQVYGEMISESDRRDARESRRNAEIIIGDARDSKEDLAVQYVMFETAKDIAVTKGDCRTAVLALRELNRRFDDFDFWGEIVGVVQDSGKSLGRTGDHAMASELERVLRVLIDEAILRGEPRTASKLVAFGMKAASRNGDAKALEFYKAKGRESSEVAKLQKQYENAVVKLAGDPENSNANIQKGRYLIVVRRDFKGALECWKMSDDDELLAIVKDESASGANASFLARRWQNLGGDSKTAFGRRCYERAIEVLKSAGKLQEASDLQKNLGQ